MKMSTIIEDKIISQKLRILSKYIDLYFDGQCKLTDYIEERPTSGVSKIIIYYRYIMNGDYYPKEIMELKVVDFILFKDMLDKGEFE
jgi:hypothetical protein